MDAGREWSTSSTARRQGSLPDLLTADRQLIVVSPSSSPTFTAAPNSRLRRLLIDGDHVPNIDPLNARDTTRLYASPAPHTTSGG